MIASTTLSGNEADFGGGLYVGYAASVDLTGSTVEGNVAETGGGVYLREGASLWAGGCGERSAVAPPYDPFEGLGGGIAVLDEQGSATVSGTEVDGNLAENGAGIATSAHLVLTDVSVHDNRVLDLYGLGGGLMVYRGELENLGNPRSPATSRPAAAART